MSEKIVKIGGASGFWGDSALGAPQLVAAGIDYLVFDYLAELTMSILVNAKTKDPALGYATDFVDVAMKSVLKDVAVKGIKVVSNAGGMNPRACAAALQKLCDEQGVGGALSSLWAGPAESRTCRTAIDSRPSRRTRAASRRMRSARHARTAECARYVSGR